MIEPDLADFVLHQRWPFQPNEWQSRVWAWMASGTPVRILAAADPGIAADVASAIEFADYVSREAKAWAAAGRPGLVGVVHVGPATT